MLNGSLAIGLYHMCARFADIFRLCAKQKKKRKMLVPDIVELCVYSMPCTRTVFYCMQNQKMKNLYFNLTVNNKTSAQIQKTHQDIISYSISFLLKTETATRNIISFNKYLSSSCIHVLHLIQIDTVLKNIYKVPI